ncbi:MAG: phenylacetate--CoA ligase family protein [Winogradskyella sp.]|nr:phenylacetate--CoA ligase family protein [Winogradskyella sp.]
MRLFDLSLRFNGFDIRKAKSTLKQIQQIPEVEYKSYVHRKRKEVLEFHLKHNAYYNRLASNVNTEDWNTVPVLTKSQLQTSLNNRLSDGYSTTSVYTNKTSGSSGHPFTFAKDKWCHALTWAVIMNRFSWYNIDFNTSKQARFYCIPLDKKGFVKERLKDALSQRTRFSVFDLSDQAFESILDSFSRKKFIYINGYTSAIVQFAKFLKRQNIVLKSICPSLRCCMVTSEMLFDEDRELMEIQFGVPVVNEYGASELDLIAFENPQSEWIVNSETLFVEILDNTNTPLPLGEEGRIVITSLYNKAHPFIRYDIGDVGMLSEHSTLKNPILKKLIGRTNDLITLPSGKRAAGLTFYYITKSIIEDDGSVKEFVIEQHALDQFTIKYVSERPVLKEKLSLIKDEIKRYLEDNINITFKHCHSLKRSSSGKLKQFTSFVTN